jgi:phosphomannomutase
MLTNSIFLGERESYGCLVGDFVRDKDAVSACCMMAELVAHLAMMISLI